MHRPISIAARVALGIALASWCSPVLAQPRQGFEELLREGVELRRAGNDGLALQRFEAALAIQRDPRALAQVGLAHQALGHWIEAERFVSEALSARGHEWIRRNQASLASALAVIREHLGSIFVTGGPVGAELIVSGQRIAQLPMREPARVVAGSATVELRLEDRLDGACRIRVEPSVVTRREYSDLMACAAPTDSTPPQSRSFDTEQPPASRVVAPEPPTSREYQRFSFDIGGGQGWAFLTGRPSYAEQRVLLDSMGQVVGRNCGDYVCYATIDPGFSWTYFLQFNARYVFTRRFAVGVGARIQFGAADWTIESATGGTQRRSNPFANLLLTLRGYVAVTSAGWSRTNLVVAPFVGGGVGQIEPKPSLPDRETRPGAHVLSGYGNLHVGVRVERPIGSVFHVAGEVALQFMFPTFLFDIDYTLLVGLHF